jgi:hypothetical protein
MAKFPTEVERSVTVKVPIERAYAYFWDVVGSSHCVPGIGGCKDVGKNTYLFTFKERSAGLVSLAVRYTCRYQGNGVDEISFETIGAKNDNTDVNGHFRLKSTSDGGTKVVLWQKLAPETPVPTLLQGFIRSFVEKEAGESMRLFLANSKKEIEAK